MEPKDVETQLIKGFAIITKGMSLDESISSPIWIRVFFSVILKLWKEHNVTNEMASKCLRNLMNSYETILKE